jgi:PAS domain S-box-containing protein
LGATFFNRRWLEFTGRALEQELGFGWAEGTYPDDYERCLTTYRRAYETRTPFSIEFRLRRADGLYRWVEDAGVPYVRPDGGFEGFVGVCADVTDRKQEELERDVQLLRERAARVEAEADAELARAEADAAVLRSAPPRTGPGSPPVTAPPPLPPSAVALPPRPAPRKPPTSVVGLVSKRPRTRPGPPKPPRSLPPREV